MYISGFNFALLHLLVAAYRGVFRTQSNIYNGAFFPKILNGFKLLTILARKLHRRCLTRLKIDLWLLAIGLEIFI